MPSHVLVTGGAGYLGGILCEHLLDAGYHVTAIDNLMYGQRSLFHLCGNERFDFVRGDVRDESLIGRLIERHDVLMPMAAIVGAPACDRDPWLAQPPDRADWERRVRERVRTLKRWATEEGMSSQFWFAPAIDLTPRSVWREPVWLDCKTETPISFV